MYKRQIHATVAKHAGELPVKLVAVRVGTLRQVVPVSLSFYWDIVARDTFCEGSKLELTEIRTRLCCGVCRHEWEPVIPAFRCPKCTSASVTVLCGEELEVDYIEVEEPAHA